MKRSAPAGPALGGLTLALLLLALGLVMNRSGLPASTAPDSPRVVLLGIRGLSWQSVVDLMAEERLPTLDRLVAGESAKGDLIAPGYRGDAEVLASVVTGRFPFKHGVRTDAQLARFDREPDPPRRTLWSWIASRGGSVAALGFPFAGAGEGDLLIASGRGPSPHPALRRLEVQPAEVPESLLVRVAAGSTLDAEDLATLRSCLADDLTRVAQAEDLLRREPDRHLFVYLDGLHDWELAYGRVGPARDAYYEFTDRILGRLLAANTTATSWLLFSERGNPEGPIGYRPHFPRLARWPPIGFFLAWGNGVQRSTHAHAPAPVDLATTLAYLSGSPLSDDMDGAVLFGLLDDGHAIRQPPLFRPGG